VELVYVQRIVALVDASKCLRILKMYNAPPAAMANSWLVDGVQAALTARPTKSLTMTSELDWLAAVQSETATSAVLCLERKRNASTARTRSTNSMENAWIAAQQTIPM
jgi:hypothetical protein